MLKVETLHTVLNQLFGKFGGSLYWNKHRYVVPRLVPFNAFLGGLFFATIARVYEYLCSRWRFYDSITSQRVRIVEAVKQS
jgi:hypothetical protein